MLYLVEIKCQLTVQRKLVMIQQIDVFKHVSVMLKLRVNKHAF